MKHFKIIIIIAIFLIGVIPIQSIDANEEIVVEDSLELDSYIPVFNPLNIKEDMTLTPIFTPDNAISTYVGWIKQANTTIEIQNQYIKYYGEFDDWVTSPPPLVKALVDAAGRGVKIRVQVRDDSDTFDVTSYLNGITNIDVRWMGNSASPDGDFLSTTHNKLMIVDSKVILISSINFGSAFTNNREAGMVIQNANAATHFLSIFEADWADGEIPLPVIRSNGIKMPTEPSFEATDYPSHTNLEKTNFTGTYNITLFTNPDNADEVIFKSLKAAKKSIYVSMYTISRPDFNNTLIELKKANPTIDIQVLISSRRVGGSENVDTWSAVKSLVDNLIPVYNASVDAFINKAGFYHNKYWIIDGKDTFVYSGNWSPRSVTPQLEDGDTSYASGEPNRDMGVAVHDATDIATYYKNVWNQDVAVADAWELPIGIKQNSFEETDIISGNVKLSGVVNGINATTVYYRFKDTNFKNVTLVNGAFSVDFDTKILENGITTFEVLVEGTQNFTDKVKVNIVNIASEDNWRVLITEVHADPNVVSDSQGEYFEITNSFPFSVLIGGWQVGDNGKLFTFADNYEIPAYTSLIFAKNSAGFASGFSETADFELGISLVNSGDFIQLLNNKGEYMDVVAYGSATAPDGSEVISKPGAGESISRINLHIDTDKATDFELTEPSPKADVPKISLGEIINTISKTSTVSTEINSEIVIEPYPFIWMIVGLIIIPRRKKILEQN